MATRPQWRNVDAPNLTGALQGYRQFSEMMGAAAQNIQSGVAGLGAEQRKANEQEVLKRLLNTTDPTQLNSNILSGLPSNTLTPGIYDVINNRNDVIRKNALSDLNIESQQQTLDTARKAADNLVNAQQLFGVNTSNPATDATALAKLNDTSEAEKKLRTEQEARFINLARGRITDQFSFNAFNQIMTDAGLPQESQQKVYESLSPEQQAFGNAAAILAATPSTAPVNAPVVGNQTTSPANVGGNVLKLSNNFSTEADVRKFSQDYSKDLSGMSERTGLPVSFFQTVAEREGGLQGAGSDTGALGQWQFVRSTWNNLSKQNPDLNIPLITDANVGTADDPRLNMNLSNQQMELLVKDNSRQLKDSGLPVTSANVWFMHNLGPKSAIPFLKNGTTTGAIENTTNLNGRRRNESVSDYMTRISNEINSGEAKWAASSLVGSSNESPTPTGTFLEGGGNGLPTTTQGTPTIQDYARLSAAGTNALTEMGAQLVGGIPARLLNPANGESPSILAESQRLSKSGVTTGWGQNNEDILRDVASKANLGQNWAAAAALVENSTRGGKVNLGLLDKNIKAFTETYADPNRRLSLEEINRLQQDLSSAQSQAKTAYENLNRLTNYAAAGNPVDSRSMDFAQNAYNDAALNMNNILNAINNKAKDSALDKGRKAATTAKELAANESPSGWLQAIGRAGMFEAFPDNEPTYPEAVVQGWREDRFFGDRKSREQKAAEDLRRSAEGRTSSGIVRRREE